MINWLKLLQNGGSVMLVMWIDIKTALCGSFLCVNMTSTYKQHCKFEATAPGWTYAGLTWLVGDVVAKVWVQPFHTCQSSHCAFISCIRKQSQTHNQNFVLFRLKKILSSSDEPFLSYNGLSNAKCGRGKSSIFHPGGLWDLKPRICTQLMSCIMRDVMNVLK